MTMRIRQVKPSFFKDPLMAELTPPVRLFYVGLWMLADDAGWFRWDVAEVGNELYGYEPRGRISRGRCKRDDRDGRTRYGKHERCPCQPFDWHGRRPLRDCCNHTNHRPAPARYAT